MVPVPEVHYLQPLASRQEQRRMLREGWPLLVQGSAPAVLLDTVPELDTEALSLAQKKHVILTLAQVPEWLPSHPFPAGSAHQVSVTTAPRPSAPINVRVNTIA